MRMEQTRLKKKFNLLACNAFFTALETQGAPWADQTKPAQASNLAYLYYSRSRNKILAEMVAESSSAMSAYAEILLQLFADKWARLYDLYTAEYDPLENYNMVESGMDVNIKTGSLDRSGAITRTGSLDRSGSLTRNGLVEHTNTLTKTGMETVNDDLAYSGKEKNSRSGDMIESGLKADNDQDEKRTIYGYNSSVGVDADSTNKKTAFKTKTEFNNYSETKEFLNDRTDSRTITKSYDEDYAETNTGHDRYTQLQDADTRKDTYNHIADTDTRKDTYNNIKDDTRHNLTRAGNIGVMTTQQMFEQEIEIRRNLFFETVFSDIDYVLTIPIY